jgi:hypothetical protein
MADVETLRTRLAEAETAMHALAMGTRVVEVVRDGRRVKYSESGKGELSAYIDSLTRQIEALEGASSGSLPRRRFIPVVQG